MWSLGMVEGIASASWWCKPAIGYTSESRLRSPSTLTPPSIDRCRRAARHAVIKPTLVSGMKAPSGFESPRPRWTSYKVSAKMPCM